MNSMQNNKFESNKKYFTISVYAIGVVLVSALIVRSIFMWEQTSATLRGIISVLSPFMAGAFIAFVLNPLVKTLNKNFFEKVCKMNSARARNGLSILISYILGVGLVVVAFLFILPQVFKSLGDLAVMIPGWYEKLLQLIKELEERFPELDFAQINREVDSLGQTIFSYDSVKAALTNIMPVVFNTSISLVKIIVNALIALMVSCYLLIDKKIISANFKKLIYALFQRDSAALICKSTRECGDILSSFISGKSLDSLIIGILCFIVMNILKLPYALIISVIVGITNMIPYFGPYIGAVPGAIILVMISPVKMVIYLLMILVIQQFDGLYLGPKILGDSTGLRPVWIIFAVSVGGAAAGVVGMFLGVPVVAAVAHLTNQWLDYRIRKRQEAQLKDRDEAESTGENAGDNADK